MIVSQCNTKANAGHKFYRTHLWLFDMYQKEEHACSVRSTRLPPSFDPKIYPLVSHTAYTDLPWVGSKRHLQHSSHQPESAQQPPVSVDQSRSFGHPILTGTHPSRLAAGLSIARAQSCCYCYLVQTSPQLCLQLRCDNFTDNSKLSEQYFNIRIS